jgi:hypothetical protein
MGAIGAELLSPDKQRSLQNDYRARRSGAYNYSQKGISHGSTILDWRRAFHAAVDIERNWPLPVASKISRYAREWR